MQRDPSTELLTPWRPVYAKQMHCSADLGRALRFPVSQYLC